MRQVEPAARVVPQAFGPVAREKSEGLAPPSVMAMPVSGALPELVSVAVCAAEVEPV